MPKKSKKKNLKAKTGLALLFIGLALFISAALYSLLTANQIASYFSLISYILIYVGGILAISKTHIKNSLEYIKSSYNLTTWSYPPSKQGRISLWILQKNE